MTTRRALRLISPTLLALSLLACGSDPETTSQDPQQQPDMSQAADMPAAPADMAVDMLEAPADLGAPDMSAALDMRADMGSAEDMRLQEDMRAEGDMRLEEDMSAQEDMRPEEDMRMELDMAPALTSQVRVVSGYPGAFQFCRDGVKLGTPIDRVLAGQGPIQSGYHSVTSGSALYRLALFPNYDCGSFSGKEEDFDLDPGKAYTVYALPQSDFRDLLLLEDDAATPGAGLARLRIHNTMSDMDVCELFGTTALATVTSSARTSAYIELAAGATILEFRQADGLGTCSGAPVGLSNVSLGEDTSSTLFVHPLQGERAVSVCAQASAGMPGPSRCVERLMDEPVEIAPVEKCNMEGWCRETEILPEINASYAGDGAAMLLEDSSVIFFDGKIKRQFTFPNRIFQYRTPAWFDGTHAYIFTPDVSFFFDGTKWSVFYTPFAEQPWRMDADSPSNLFIARDQNLAHYDGAQWDSIPIPNNTERVWSVRATGPKQAVALTADLVVHFFDGAQWSTQTTLPAARSLLGVDNVFLAAGQDDITYVDDLGMIQRYDGVSWTAQAPSSPNDKLDQLHHQEQGDLWGSTSCSGFGSCRIARLDAQGMWTFWDAAPGVSPSKLWVQGADRFWAFGTRSMQLDQGVLRPQPIPATYVDLWCDASEHAMLNVGGDLWRGALGEWDTLTENVANVDSEPARRIARAASGAFVYSTNRKVIGAGFPSTISGFSTMNSQNFGGIWMPAGASQPYVGFHNKFTRPGYSMIATHNEYVLYKGGQFIAALDPGIGSFEPGEIWGSSEQDIYMVAREGALLHYDGTQLVPLAGINTRFSHVHGSGAADVWVLGGGKIFHYDGVTWTQLAQAPGLGAKGVDVAGAGERVVVVGDNETLRIFDRAMWTLHNPVLGEEIAVARSCGDTVRVLTREGSVYSKSFAAP